MLIASPAASAAIATAPPRTRVCLVRLWLADGSLANGVQLQLHRFARNRKVDPGAEPAG
jgi:hypothetical protein